MRRLVLEDPFARSAIWSRNLAVFALVVALIGIALSRKGLDPQAAISVIGGALAIAALAVLCALFALAVIWRTGFRGTGLALGGIALAGLLFAYPAYLAVEARTQPRLIDVSTDLDDPPRFLETQEALKARHDVTPPRTISANDRAVQEQLYPDLQPLDLDADAGDVVDAIHTLIKRRHWTLVDEQAPENFATGRIDAVAASTVMGFPIDIAIRVRPLGNRTRVDVRSVSRRGWQEQSGADAARVAALISDIEDSIGGS